MSKLVMGYWDCPVCGTKEIRGDVTNCPSCGRARGEVQFYMKGYSEGETREENERSDVEYLNEETLTERVPVLRMLRESPESVRSRAETLCGMIRERNVRADLAVEEVFSQVGGGSMPTVLIKSAAVVIRPRGMSAAGLEKQMRHLDVPVICRVAEDAVILDVRTIPADDFEEAALLLGEVLA